MARFVRWLAILLLVAIAAAVGVALALRVPPGPEPAATAFTLPDVQVVTPARERSRGRTLRIHEGAITSIDGGALPPVGTVLERFAGHTVLPGIVNMHTHLPAESPLGLTAYFGLLQVAHGVTTVREAGDMDGTTVAAARRAFEDEGWIGPRVVPCGPFVGGSDPRWANSVVVTSPAQAPGVVARLVASGARCMKLYDDLDLPRIRALVDAARAADLPVIGHVPFGLTFEEARVPDTQHLMGVARPEDIERGDHVVFRIVDWRRVDEARMDEVVAATRAHGLAHTPTLVSTHQLRHYQDYEAARRDPTVVLLPRLFRDVAWHPRDGIPFYRDLGPEDLATIRDAHQKKLRLVAKLHAAGAPLFVGTDTQQPFVVPGAAAWMEMRLFAEAGIPTEKVWAHATWRAGRALGVADLGTVAAGAPADLLVFRDDPSRELAALESLAAVVAAGRLYLREDLEAAIARYQEHYAGVVVDTLSVAVARRIMRDTVKRGH